MGIWEQKVHKSLLMGIHNEDLWNKPWDLVKKTLSMLKIFSIDRYMRTAQVGMYVLFHNSSVLFSSQYLLRGNIMVLVMTTFYSLDKRETNV